MSNDSPDHDPDQTPKVPSSGMKSVKGTELDLWDFDSDDIEPKETKKPEKQIPSRSLPTKRVVDSPIRSKIPIERQIDPPAPEKITVIPVDPAIDQEAEEKSAKADAPVPAKDETVPVKVAEPAPPEKEKTEAEKKISDSPESTDKPSDESAIETLEPPSSFVGGLSKAEKLVILALIGILALGAILTVMHFSSRVPTRSILSEKPDLPAVGKLVTITDIGSFWREPITTGDERDIVRRGTKLIPVVRLKLEAKSAVIRVFFRNEDGNVIGDPINRLIEGNAEVSIPATAGFDDIGMHAAYRTGESMPWTVQILEAKDSSLSIDKFNLVLEAEISTDIR